MQIKLVEVTSHDNGWKGTWYKTGQRHFVRQCPDYPRVVATRWQNLGRVSGGIDEKDCAVLTGLVVWLLCAAKTIQITSRPITPAFWKRLWQNYRIGRDACDQRRWPAIKSAWTYTRMGC
jgi:hypothetical protein